MIEGQPPAVTIPDDLMSWPSAYQAARLKRVTPATIYNWIKTGRLRVVHTNVGMLVDPHDLRQVQLDPRWTDKVSDAAR